MKKEELAKMPTDALWKLYQDVAETLADKIIAEKQGLDAKLARLKHGPPGKRAAMMPPRQRRRYPKVLQKYRNPQDHSQTWSGRGKQPHWVTKLLNAGAELDDLVTPQFRRAALRRPRLTRPKD